MVLVNSIITAVLLAGSSLAHNTHSPSDGPRIKRDLDHCSAKLKARGHEERVIAKRAELAHARREERALAHGMFSR